MKILYCDARCDMAGHFGLNASRLCQALSKLGHDVYLITNKIYPERFLKEEPAFKTIEVYGGRLTMDKFSKIREKKPYYFYYGYFRNSFLVFKEALRFARINNVDVLHGTGIEFGVASILLKTFSGKLPPVIWEVQAANFSFKKYSGTFFQRIYKALQRRIFKTVIGKEIKAFAVLGEYQKQELKKQLLLKDGFPMEVIREGGNGPLNILDKNTARKKIGLGEHKDKIIFLFFGLLRRDKGIEFLLNAIPQIKSSKFLLVIAGAPVHYKKEEIQGIINKLGIGDKVFLRLGYIPEEDVSNYFFACDALVLPYSKKYSGGSGPLFNEGGACTHSRPVIASDVSEMGNVIKNYNLGLLFEPENPLSIAERMEYFINLNELEKKKFADNAFNFARQNTWEVRAAKYSELYQRVLEKS